MIGGIFVGGASRRMGGRPKGLLLAPPEAGRPSRTSIVERTAGLLREQCERVVLVGRAEAYATLGLATIDDAPGEGPLAGLVALLEHAGSGGVIALACDMPYVQSALIARLASFAPGAAAVAARDGGVWSPLFARYDAARAGRTARIRLDAGDRALYVVLDALGEGASELPLSPEERASLRDWDEPGDLLHAREQG